MSTDDTISRSIRALAAYRDISGAALAAEMGLPRSAYYNRLSGETHWSAAEVARAADILGVPVETLYRGLQGAA